MRLKHFISVFLALLFLGVGQVWAEDGTLVITRSCFPSGSLAYNVTDAWSATASTSETVSGQGDLYSTATQTTMQTKNSGVSTHYHNTTALPGALKSIEVSVASGTDRTYTVYASASAAITSTTGLTSIGTVNGSTSLTGIDTSKGYKYFWMQCGGGASFLSSITITYEVSGDDPTPAVTSDPASWDFGAVATDAAASKVFSISGSDLEAGTLTLTAPSGYSVSPASITVASAGDLDATNVTVSKNTTTAGSYNDNLTISGCGLEDDVEVALSMEVKAKYTVTWNNNGSTSTSEVLDGEKPIFPATPAACDATSTTFIGWATAPWDGKIANLTGKTVYTSADAMPAVSGAVTYYAVFAKSSGSAADLFSWAGGSSSDLATAAGATQNVGSDYASGNAPYLVKLDGTGKYILIAIASQPGKVALDVKMIGGANTSSITVQEADETDGEFTDVETLSISGAQNDVLNLETSNSFKSTTRAIKLYFTKGSNVGVGPITIEGAVAYADYMTTCCTKYNVNIAAGITNGTVSADLAQACEGTTVTLTFTPAGSYHLESWSVNGTEQDVAENTFTMPGEAVTVSATFAHDACENLAAPTLNGEIVKTYNSATIAWNTVTGAQAYVVSVVNHETSEVVFSSDDYDELSKALTGLEPETQYDYSIMAVGDGVEKCAEGNPALAGNFTTNALPTAHLTLMNLGAEHASSGDYAILTPFNLPTTAATCSKAFVGWDADADCAVAPTYAPGAEFTFANTTGVTLYAVYADVAAGPTTNIAYLNTETTTNMTGGNDAALLGLNAEEWSVVGAKGGNSNYPGLNKAKDIRLYYQSEDVGNTITITAPQTIASVALTFTADDYSNAWVKVGGEAVTLSDGVYPINANTFVIGNANTSNVQVRISNIAVNFPGTQSNWATTCLDAPVATPDPASIEAAAAGTSGTITMTYDNVNTSELAVALYSNAACTEAFTGSWLTASINGDKNIAYTIAENTSYNDARTAYIKLTAPETTGATAPAVVVIPVSQAKKAAVFSSLEELVAADVNANTNVTVSFSNVVIKDIYYYNSNRRGLIFDIQKADEDIKIYYNADVPAEWVAGGKVSGTLTDCPWKIYSGAWQLAPASGFVWATDLSYTAPAEVSTVVVSGSPSKTTYVDGEKLNPAGLSVRVNYTDETYEDNPVGVTFSEVVLHEGDTEAEITATYGTTTSDAYTVTGLTVGAIPNKTIAEFIAAEGTRCYLEGIVSNITNTTYGNFDLTDASGSIYV